MKLEDINNVVAALRKDIELIKVEFELRDKQYTYICDAGTIVEGDLVITPDPRHAKRPGGFAVVVEVLPVDKALDGKFNFKRIIGTVDMAAYESRLNKDIAFLETIEEARKPAKIRNTIKQLRDEIGEESFKMLTASLESK